MAIAIKIEEGHFLLPESNDPCSLWISYYQKLVKEVGKNNARMLWLITWKSNGAISCATNPTFNRWLLKNELDISNMATRTIADLSEIGGNVLGMGKNLTKILSIGIPVVLAVILVSVIVIIRNSSKNVDLEDLAMLTPAGRSLKLLGK